MARLHIQRTAVIDARTEDVYNVISDYRTHHPKILPKAYFSNLRVKKGGKGAGTEIQVMTHFMGVKRELQMTVTEPEPGRVLAETDSRTNMVTTFTLTPLNNGQQTSLTIATDWDSAPGLAGLIERLMTPRAMRKIYGEEMILLQHYMANYRTPQKKSKKS